MLLNVTCCVEKCHYQYQVLGNGGSTCLVFKVENSLTSENLGEWSIHLFIKKYITRLHLLIKNIKKFESITLQTPIKDQNVPLIKTISVSCMRPIYHEKDLYKQLNS